MVDLAFQPQPQQEAAVVPELVGQRLQRPATGATPGDLPDQARSQLLRHLCRRDAERVG